MKRTLQLKDKNLANKKSCLDKNLVLNEEKEKEKEEKNDNELEIKTAPEVFIKNNNMKSKNANCLSNLGRKLKVVAWNVAGLRACIKKGFGKHIEEINPDVVCLTEVKSFLREIPKSFMEGYHRYWNACKIKKGYSGSAILTRIKPLNYHFGIDNKKHDQEGRVTTLEFDNYYIVVAYVPNAGDELIRLSYRMEWDTTFHDYLKKLSEKKPVCLCGDLNVAHEEIDVDSPSKRHGTGCFTKEERGMFTKLLNQGFIDVYRYMHPKKQAYTFWSYRGNVRSRNKGWRLDYFLVSKSLISRVEETTIHSDFNHLNERMSDHAPISLVMSI